MTNAVIAERNNQPGRNGRNGRGEWWPAQPVELAPINAWPPQPARSLRWLVGFPGYIWPYNAFWLVVTLVTWHFLTPPIATMATFEAWWLGWLLVRNLAMILVVFGGIHAYLYILKRQGDELRFTTKPFATDARRFLFRNQVRDNMFLTLASAVPVMTAYGAITYWAFANGYFGFFDLSGQPVAFWAWFVVLLLIAPFIHAVHFYLGHRLLHARLCAKRVGRLRTAKDSESNV